jgi:hypothetical protein
VKYFVGSSQAIEGIVVIWNQGLSATILYEKHVGAGAVSGLNWYYGMGGHEVIHNDRYFNDY